MVLGEDSQVRIFIANQESMQRKVASKILPPEIAMDEEKLQRFKREVKLGRRNTRYIEVLDGLEAGERVITSPYSGFRDMDQLVLNKKNTPE